MKKHEIEYIETSKLKLNEKNPRLNDCAVDAVAKSIEKYGFKNPIIIDKDYVVYCGNTRLKASLKLGLKEVPCIIADDLTKKQIREYAILDNKTNELAEWNYELLSEELNELDLGEFNLDWDIPELIKSNEIEEDEFDGAIPEQPKAKTGDIYLLGSHRLMCGDSTNEEDVKRLMNSETADLVLTDPPYNVDYEGKTKDRLKIENDNQEDENFLLFLKKAFYNFKQHLKNGGAFYIWHADTESYNFRLACKQNELKVRQCLIWNKNSIVLGRQDYHWKHEPCLYGWKEGASHYFIDDRTQGTVIDEDKPFVSDLHPTMKPVRLLARLIQNSSRKGELVLDLFGGSGSTLIACEQLNRKCFMMELDPRYVDAIVKRWEDFAGKKAERIACGGGQFE